DWADWSSAVNASPLIRAMTASQSEHPATWLSTRENRSSPRRPRANDSSSCALGCDATGTMTVASMLGPSRSFRKGRTEGPGYWGPFSQATRRFPFPLDRGFRMPDALLHVVDCLLQLLDDGRLELLLRRFLLNGGLQSVFGPDQLFHRLNEVLRDGRLGLSSL